MDRKQKIAMLKNYKNLLIAYQNEIKNNKLKPKEKSVSFKEIILW